MQRTVKFPTAASRLERSSNFELFAWFFMRVSGIILLFISLFHIYYMHFVVDVAEIDFLVIAERWSGASGILWRTFDMALLFFAFRNLSRKRIIETNEGMADQKPYVVPGDTIIVPAAAELTVEELESFPGYQGPAG